MAELAINPPGQYTDYFIVSFDDGPYSVPKQGSDFTVRLRGHLPRRSAAGGINYDQGVGADEGGIVVIHRFFPWSDRIGAGGLLQFEGFVKTTDGMWNAQGALAFDSVQTPPGIISMLGYEGVSSENLRRLTDLPAPPLGTLRMW